MSNAFGAAATPPSYDPNPDAESDRELEETTDGTRPNGGR